MINKHRFKIDFDVKCPFDGCGKTFIRKLTVEYVTNQRGDIVSTKVV